MSTLSKHVMIEFLTKFDKNLVKPKSRKFTWIPSDDSSSLQVISDFAIIPAGGTVTLSYASHADGILTVFEDPDKTGDLTLKINGNTNGNRLSYYRVISGAITGLIAINASATENRVVKFYTIIPSGVISSGETALSLGLIIDFLGLSDTPDSYTGYAGYTVKVKANATGLEFIENNVFPIRTISSTGNIISTDDIIIANTSGGGFTLTLISPVTTGKVYRIIKTTGFDIVTIVAGSGTINGAASYELTIPYEGKGFVYDGTNWFTVNLS